MSTTSKRRTPLPALWPCTSCGSPGVMNLGTHGYCSAHLRELFAGFKSSAIANAGIGLGESMATQFGQGFRWLTCVSCGAEWAERPGSRCVWCTRRVANQIAHQRDLDLTPPDVDAADARHDAAVEAWAARLRVAVEARRVSRSEATTALTRFLDRTAA